MSGLSASTPARGPRPEFYAALGRWIGFLVLAISCLVLAGWIFDIASLRSLAPAWVSMKANTALCLLLLSLSLLCLDPGPGAYSRRDPPPGRPVPTAIGAVSAALGFSFASATLLEYLSGLELGIDELFFRDVTAQTHTLAPGRMAFPTAFCLGCLGLAYCLRAFGGARRCFAARMLCNAVLPFALVSILSYSFGVFPEMGLGSGTYMALHTALCLCLLAAGLPLLDPDRGLWGLIRGGGSAGKVSRRLAPAAVFVPVVIAGLKLMGDRIGLYEPSFGVILVATTYMALLSVLVVWTARSLEKSDEVRERAERAVHESEERFSKAFAASPMGQSISTLAEGLLVDVNLAYCRIVGYSRDELLDHTSTELGLFSDPADRARLVAALGRGLAVRDVQVRVRTRSGKAKTVLVSMIPIELGGRACLISSIVDISAKLRAERELRESEERYRGLFENMIEGFAYCRMEYEGEVPVDFTYLAVNPSFTSLTGLSNVVGRRASEIVEGIRDRDPGFFEAYGRIARTRVPERFEVEVSSLGMWLAISVYFPAPGYFVAVFDVITERKRAEAELIRLNAELEERVRRRTSELEEANAELESFSYSVSHDLRSPLRGIDGWSAALEEDYGPSLDEAAVGYIRRVRAESQRMGGLIDSLLQLARVGRAEMSREELDLSELSRSVAERLREGYAGRDIEFVIQDGLRARCDRKFIEIAIVNLLDNACKFSSKRELARVEFGREADSSFYVRDNGAGFDMAYASKLFAPFQRMHKSSEFPGTGIGLATVQRIVAKHGGRIWAEAKPGEGATFRFTLEDPA